MSNQELNEFINKLEKNIHGLIQYINFSNDKLGQNYFPINNFSQNIMQQLSGMKLFYDLEKVENNFVKISKKKVVNKFNNLAAKIKDKNISVFAESELVSYDYEVNYDSFKVETILNCILENAQSSKAKNLNIKASQRAQKVEIIFQSDGEVIDKNKSAPFQKIGHKLILKICKQLAYNVDFIKSDQGFMTRITI